MRPETDAEFYKVVESGDPVAASPTLREFLSVRRLARFALYPSSGLDRKPFRFLHPEFLRRRFFQEAANLPEVTGFIYVDRRGPWLRSGRARLEEDSEQLRLRTLRQETVEIAGLRGELLALEACSAGLAAWSPWVLAFQADNRRVAEILNREEIRPELLIGFSDGCRPGGNDRCVLDAFRPLLRLRPPWRVADHFGPHPECSALDTVGVQDSNWGNYQGSSDRPLTGASLFRVPVPPSPKSQSIQF